MTRQGHIALISPAVGTGNVGDHFIETAIRRLLGDEVAYHRIGLREALSDEDLALINDCACAVICGSNLYQRDWASALTRSDFKRIRVPIIPFGVGSSAADLRERRPSRATRKVIRYLHSRCELGSVRDPHTQEVVAGAGVDNSILTGCPVLHWATLPSLPPIAPSPRRRIVLTARNWLMHAEPHNIDHPVQAEFLERLLARLSGEDLLFAAHEDFDLRLVDRLEIPRERVLFSDDPEDYVALYTDPGNVVIALRLHAGMLALASGVPAVFVGHDTRTYSFCDMLGLDYVSLFDEDAVDRTVAGLERVLEGDVSGFTPAHQRFGELSREMSRFLEANSLPRAGVPGGSSAAPAARPVRAP